MMKQVNFRMPRRILALACGLILAASAFAQQVAVKGHVKDATGEPIIGATIRIDGQTGGVVTDYDGNFTLQAPAGATITVSYIGYDTQTLTASSNMDITLSDDVAKSLNEVVVIGYGQVKKSDLTGSVTALKPDMKNKGVVVNPQDMLAGKAAGVNITSDGGAPGGKANIRIRGGSSLNASNDPLIVIDGLAIDNNGVKGLSNILSMVNPQDIESFNILKDASATAIYGSRGSNGVIIITTKKGRKNMKPQVSYNGSATMSWKKNGIHVMDGNSFREYVTSTYGAGSTQANLLGTANTDWQDEIYQRAFSHDHSVTVAGAVKDLPYRFSLGYTDQEGILKTSEFERYTASVNLNPSFLDDHLKLNLNGKGMFAKTNYANTDAIGAALWMDPTQSPYAFTSVSHLANLSPNALSNFGGYFEWPANGSALNDPTYAETFQSNATGNPVALLNGKNDVAHSRAFIGSADVDYQIHGFEDLHLHATGGIDLSQGVQTTDLSPFTPDGSFYYSSHGYEKIFKRNLSLSTYAQYLKDFTEDHHFDIMAGYEWQHFYRNLSNKYYGFLPATNNSYVAGDYNFYNPDTYNYKTENYLVSFFGRANYTLMNRYFFTATLRADGSSRFEDHWAWFPSFAFAWKMKDENIFKDIDWLSDLKMRLGYGMTGQQDGNGEANSIGDYNYFATYTINSGINSYYPILGNGVTYTPVGYDPKLKWETTTTYNIGLDWGLFNQRLTGSIDWYYRETTDLLNFVSVPAGAEVTNMIMRNIGSLKNEGIELSIDWKAIQTKDIRWNLGYNFTFNHNRITKLTDAGDAEYRVLTGGISAGTGNKVQAYRVGEAANAFYVYQQVYDQNGMPIEGQVVDRNGNGEIDQGDRYYYKSPAPPVTMGFSSRFEWKNFDFGFSLRANIGNYVYNDTKAGFSDISKIYESSFDCLKNRPWYDLQKNWQSTSETSVCSDYYVQNASFLKVDNITIGYSFNDLFKTASWQGVNGRIYATANNVYTLTKYDGVDPEVFGGIDNNIYPRPFSVVVGLSLNF